MASTPRSTGKNTHSSPANEGQRAREWRQLKADWKLSEEVCRSCAGKHARMHACIRTTVYMMHGTRS
jgi:hypothetical protein